MRGPSAYLSCDLLIRPVGLDVLLVPLEESALSSSEDVTNLLATKILSTLGEGSSCLKW